MSFDSRGNEVFRLLSNAKLKLLYFTDFRLLYSKHIKIILKWFCIHRKGRNSGSRYDYATMHYVHVCDNSNVISRSRWW